jgi:hypothetical protein
VALNMQPLKRMPRKGVPAQSKKRGKPKANLKSGNDAPTESP